MNCSSLESVSIPGNVIVIRSLSFSGCSSLKKIILNDGIKTIESQTFSGTPITELIIPDSVTSIAGYTHSYYPDRAAFANCKYLTKVVIGKGITSLEQNVFYGCSSISQVYYTGTEDEWNNIYFHSGNDYLKKAPITFNYKPE